MRRALIVSLCAAAVGGAFYASNPLRAQPTPPATAAPVDISAGPYIADRAVIEQLDRADAHGDCAKSGPLVFACLIQALAGAKAAEPPIGALANPFNLKVAAPILATVKSDLDGFHSSGIESDQQIAAGFLTDAGSRLELVGVVNRIDRQFIQDSVPGSEDAKRCGEISLIYRFSYSLRNGDVASRLPVTMNVVMPAIPHAQPAGAASCKDIAARWVQELARPAGRTPDQVVADLTNPATGVIAPIDGRDIERIELNIQAYRISAGSDQTDLGSTAEYVIRVFRWDPDKKAFEPSYLTNEVDRARLLGAPKGDANSCDRGVSRPISKAKFLAYLLSPAVLSDIDTGTLNLPKEYLACRAVSASPGGGVRSNNQLYWNAAAPSEQLLGDAEIAAAMKAATTSKRQFSFMRTPDDVRTRLNELSCRGCHQARAIAGFHFPGADREAAPVSNAVLLPGSPQFYGDQPRRNEILQKLASGAALSRYQLAAGYGSRPLNRFASQLVGTQLLGGWGGACLTPDAMASSQRKWTCQPGLRCAQLFQSRNAPGLGACVPDGRQEIGDALQTGQVTSGHRNQDRYLRSTPPPAGDWSNHGHRDTLIPSSVLPSNPPSGNSYYGAHQEYYSGDPTGAAPTQPEHFRIKRDAQTGGFPSGMLRLSECKGLPNEATCGLVASSGFNDCLAQVRNGTPLAQCFQTKTSYAGMRACDVAHPCRDDYICLKAMGYTAANGHDRYEARRKAVSYDPADYGQQEPDAAWLGRNGGHGDQRGICIPPYFVFQFRSDGHPAPMSKAMAHK